MTKYSDGVKKKASKPINPKNLKAPAGKPGKKKFLPLDYSYGGLDKDGGILYGGAGTTVNKKKSPIGLTLEGVTPKDPFVRKNYFRGDVKAGVNKNINPNVNVGAKLGGTMGGAMNKGFSPAVEVGATLKFAKGSASVNTNKAKEGTKAKKSKRLLKTPLDNPDYKPHLASTTRYKYGSKGVKTKQEVPKYVAGVGSIMSMFGGGGGGLGSLMGKGGGGGGGLSSMMGKGGAKGGGGGMDAGSLMDMASSKSKEKEPQPTESTPPIAPPEGGQPEATSESNKMGADIQNKLANRESGGGAAGKVPIYGSYVKMADKALDKQGQAIAGLHEQGERLNKYRQGSKGVQMKGGTPQYEGGTGYYTGREDMGGPTVFKKKNPLRKWDKVGKAMKLGSTIAGGLNAPVDKVTGGMASKGTDNVGALAGSMGNTTYAGKDYGGSAGNEKAIKNESVARQKTPLKESKIGQWGQGIGEKLSQGFKKQQQASNLENRANTAPGAVPATTSASTVSSGVGLSNKGKMESGMVDPLLDPPAFKKGTRKLKLKAKRKKRT
jgi:hypothetical protein